MYKIKNKTKGIIMSSKTKNKIESRLSFSYPEKLQEILKEEANKELRTLPSYIKLILNDYLDQKEQKNEN